MDIENSSLDKRSRATLPDNRSKLGKQTESGSTAPADESRSAAPVLRSGEARRRSDSETGVSDMRDMRDIREMRDMADTVSPPRSPRKRERDKSAAESGSASSVNGQTSETVFSTHTRSPRRARSPEGARSPRRRTRAEASEEAGALALSDRSSDRASERNRRDKPDEVRGRKSGRRSGPADVSKPLPGKVDKQSGRAARTTLISSAPVVIRREIRAVDEPLLKHVRDQARLSRELASSDAQAAFDAYPALLKDLQAGYVTEVCATQAYRRCSAQEQEAVLRNLVLACLVVWDQAMSTRPDGMRLSEYRQQFADLYHGRSSTDLCTILKQDFYSHEERWLEDHVRKVDKRRLAECDAFLGLMVGHVRAAGRFRKVEAREDLHEVPYREATADFIDWLRKKAVVGDWKNALKIDIERSSYFFGAGSGMPTHALRSLTDFRAHIQEPAIRALLATLANQNLTGFLINQFFLRKVGEDQYVSLLMTADGQALSSITWTAEYYLSRFTEVCVVRRDGAGNLLRSRRIADITTVRLDRGERQEIRAGYKLVYTGYLGKDSKGMQRNTARAIVSQEFLSFPDPSLKMHLTVRCYLDGEIRFSPFKLKAANWHQPLPGQTVTAVLPEVGNSL